MPISVSGTVMERLRRWTLILCVGMLMAGLAPMKGACAAGAFSLSVKRGSSYVYINEKEMFVTVALEGGTAPYTVEADFSLADESREVIRETYEQPGTYTISRMPRKGGDWKITVTAEDAAGERKKRTVEIRGSTRSYDTEEEYRDGLDRLRLTGDWRADLVTVAQFQLGYRESTSDYIEGDSGQEIGATRYGLWMDDPYSEWCASFIGYSMFQAQIPLVYRIGYADVYDWIESARNMNAYRRRDHQPQIGDIVFLIPRNADTASHIGIVEFVTENTIGTIEGNVNDSVARRTYYLDDERIAGYASMEAMMDDYGVKYAEDPQVVYRINDFTDRGGIVSRSKVNMRRGTDSGSERLFKNIEKGTALTVLAEIIINDERWLQVEHEGKLGYILKKYVDVDTDPAA